MTRHEGFLAHGRYRWLWAASAVAVLSIVAYETTGGPGRSAGNTTFGYASGTVGALLIVWLTTLGVRKRLFDARGALKGWVSAHVYLGLALLVIATLHTGFHFHLNVHTLAYALLVAVVASGVWGVVAYATLPRRMSANRAELTEAQMLDRVGSLNARLNDKAQGLGDADAAIVRLSISETRLGGGLLARLGVGTHRCGNRRALALISAAPRGGLDPAAGAVIADLLREKERALDQARRHIRLRTLLDLWLRVHVPLTVALLAALVAHIVSVFFYW